MKYKCYVCKKRKESNDCLLTLDINLSEVDGKELGDLIESPISSEKICGSCAKWLGVILTRGVEVFGK